MTALVSPGGGGGVGASIDILTLGSDLGPRSFGVEKGGARAGAFWGCFTWRRFRETLPAASFPPLGGGSSSPLVNEQQVRLWRLVANMSPLKRASGLVLQMDNVARQVRSRTGGGTFMSGESAEQVASIFRAIFRAEQRRYRFRAIFRAELRKRRAGRRGGTFMREYFAPDFVDSTAQVSRDFCMSNEPTRRRMPSWWNLIYSDAQQRRKYRWVGPSPNNLCPFSARKPRHYLGPRSQYFRPAFSDIWLSLLRRSKLADLLGHGVAQLAEVFW